MSVKKSQSISVFNIYASAIQSLKKKPSIYVPFIVFTLLELVGLMVLFSAPRMPLRLALGPIISTFWGEKFLHYPTNFLLLPKLASHSQTLLSIFAGSLLTGLSISLLYQKPLKSTYKKYILFFIVVLIMCALFYFSSKFLAILLLKYFASGHRRLLFIGPSMWLGPVMLVINLFIALLIQSVFVYAIPALIAGETKLHKALGKSLIFLKKHFIKTILLVGLPMLIYLPFSILTYNTSLLIYKFFPELVLYVLILSVLINSLVIDPLITISTALYYLNKREN